MTCYHPLSGFYTGLKTKNNKPDLIVVPANLDKISIYDKKLDSRREDIPLTGDHIKRGLDIVFFDGKKRSNYYLIKRVDIPCGRCIGCRLDRSRQWGVRLMKEYEYSDSAYFLTLTYENAPHDLIKSDLQFFIHKLRVYQQRHFNVNNIRYFACGEYGEQNDRPHYHIILFNCKIPDLKVVGANLCNKYYSSDYLSKIWGKGFITIGDVTFESCCYVARYSMKKVGSSCDHEVYPFALMSKKPGIGFQFYSDNLENIYSSDKVFIKRGKNVIASNPGRYCDSILDKVDSIRLTELKEHRADLSDRIKTDPNFKDKKNELKYKELLKQQSVNKLIRRI